MPARALNAADLPDDVDALKALVCRQIEREQHLEHELALVREKLNLALAKRFGRSSEQVPAAQLGLFNEAEQLAESADADTAPTDDTATEIAVPAHTRRRGGRKPLPEYLPRVRIEHDLPEAEKTCTCGCQLTRIGEDISEQLDVIPAQVRVLQHVRGKYACKACEDTIATAPLPAQPIPKSNASPGLLAHIAIAKYCDALPLARQEQILARAGIDLPRATTARWMIQLAELITPLIERLSACLLAYDILQMDETRIQVNKEADRDPASQSYLWVQRGGPPGEPVVLFHYEPSRGQQAAADLLEGYRGWLQADGYEVYGTIAAQRPEIRLIGCLAHARRKFHEAHIAQGKKRKAGKAKQALDFIGQLYGIEKRLRDKTPEQRHAERARKAKPIWEQFRLWLDQALPEVPPSTLTGKALAYLHNQWPKLIGYLDDGRLEIDNNACERAIRPFVIGRRNWLFADTPAGATASARLYALIETAKANGHEPYRYLRHLFTELPKATTPEQIDVLLPTRLAPEDVPTP
jgi:transposase